MIKQFSIILFFVFVFGLFIVSTDAQIDASTRNGKPRDEEIPKNIREALKKQEVERIRKDFEEMLKNGEEAVKLTEEVEYSFNKNNKLTSNEIQKLEKIEKLLKKIRKELGGADDAEVKVEKPSNIKSAIATLKESSANLYAELKKTSRYTISAVAIQSSNKLIDIVRFIRFWK
ncbi:MAG: hypothetical protein ACR2F2_08285 [Pyrinomonadaceae bacterium]